MYPHYITNTTYSSVTSKLSTAVAFFRHNIGVHVYISTNLYLIVASKCKSRVIKRIPGHATQKERVTLALCCNTTGFKDENRIHILCTMTGRLRNVPQVLDTLWRIKLNRITIWFSCTTPGCKPDGIKVSLQQKYSTPNYESENDQKTS